MAGALAQPKKVRMRKIEVIDALLYGCVSDVDPSPGTLPSASNGTTQPPSANHWLPAPATHRPPHAVCRGYQEEKMRDRRFGHPQTAAHLCGGRCRGKTREGYPDRWCSRRCPAERTRNQVGHRRTGTNVYRMTSMCFEPPSGGVWSRQCAVDP